MELKKEYWWHNAAIYEIFPKCFYDSNGDGWGDINGIIDKLDYLENLGIDAIWLCPIFKSGFIDGGYDVDNYYDVNPMFGRLQDIELLIKKAHEKNIKVILDITLNHTSDKHQWFLSACESKTSPYRDYYIFKNGIGGRKPNNWKSSKTLKSMWTYNEKTDDYYLHLYSKHQPDLNWANREVRKKLYSILIYWIGKGVDGFRLDVINKIAKPEVMNDVSDNSRYSDHLFENREGVHPYIKEMKNFISLRYKDILLIGQTSSVDEVQAIKYAAANRGELDLFLQFDYLDIDKGKDLKRKIWSIKKFKTYIMKWQRLVKFDVWPTVFLGSHDTGRMVSRYASDSKKYKDISAKMLATVQLFLQGTQVIYMGDEFGLHNLNRTTIDEFDDARSKAVYEKRIKKKSEDEFKILSDLNLLARDNARYMIPWKKCKTQLKRKDSVFLYYKTLLELRKKVPALKYGKTVSILNKYKMLFAYQRKYKTTFITVLANMGAEPIDIDMSSFGSEIIIGNYKHKDSGLKPYEVRVYKGAQ